MGAASPSHRMTDTDRAGIALDALRDGTARRLRELNGWTLADLARRCNVTTYKLAAWEDGTEQPTPASAVKVWRALVTACTTAPPT